MRIGRSCGIFVLTLFLVGSGCASGGGGSPRGSSGSGGGDGGDPDGSSGQAGTGGTGTSGSGGSGGTGGDDSDGGWLNDVCIMHDCDSDAECVGCPSGRNVCDESSHRCVKCVPGEPPTACAAGEECSQYGTCIPEGMTCPTDSVGEPTVTCASDADCYACDTMHQVCNTTTSKCVACNDTNMYACDQQASCKAGECLDKCPSPCATDADCENCGTMVNPGHACNETTRHCGECSATTPCPDGSVCGPQGMCIAICGDPNKAKGACQSDDDCTGCDGDLIACQVPINGGDGKCGLPAAGCSDIPGNFAVLPEPWSQVTNLCSDDADCANQGINLNVGKILRDLSGLDQINDATMHYGMNVCASVSVGIMGESYSCGVCVPCKEDADCDPIKFDPLIDQAFGPVGGLVANVLIKMAFGDAPHELNMYCEPVLGDFGVCAPCIDFLHECGVSSTTGSGCTTDWECAAGEHCKDGKCTEYAGIDCFGGDPCPSGQICSWNGGGYCCREPFVGAPEDTCFSDAECVPDVCAQSRADCSSSSDPCFYCAPPVANCESP